MQMVSAYAVFANGGYRINPYLVSKIVDNNGKVISQNKFATAQHDAPRVIDARNAFIMNSMMQDVVRYGTATKALQLGRRDLAGKTGTTNDHFDAWFTGYSPKEVAVTWVGFDKPKRLGRNETGGSTALPIWIKYMATALRNVPETDMPVPDGVMALRVDPVTGIRADNDENGIYEYFYHENPPPEVEIPLPSMLEEESLPLSQPQQMLQPDVIFQPRSLPLQTPEQPSKFKDPSAVKTMKPSDAANNKDLAANKTAEPTKPRKPEPNNTSSASEQVRQLLSPR
jgi:penicillin-binding protein 1A